VAALIPAILSGYLSLFRPHFNKPSGVSPASFTYLRQRLQRYVLGRILSAKSGEIPNLEDGPSELEAILRIVA